MSEFKGTRGEWVFSKSSLSIWHSTDVGRRLVLIDEVVEDGLVLNTETQANALLISKAPEMLDLLNRIEGELLRSDFVLTEKWYDKIQDLITKATTI